MIYPDKFSRKRIAQTDDITVLAGRKLYALEGHVLILEFQLYKLDRHRSAENRALEFS